MDTILQQLYEGNLDPVSQSQPTSKKYRTTSYWHQKHYEAFCSTLQELDPALSKRFDKLLDEMLELDYIETKKEFIDGFRLGARMMMEILDGED